LDEKEIRLPSIERPTLVEASTCCSAKEINQREVDNDKQRSIHGKGYNSRKEKAREDHGYGVEEEELWFFADESEEEFSKKEKFPFFFLLRNVRLEIMMSYWRKLSRQVERRGFNDAFGGY
jgi:hypothetical protein